MDNMPGKSRIAIVGSRGRMGSMFLEKALRAGYHACGIDRPFEEHKLKECLADAQIVLVCVPAKVFADVLAIITPFMSKESVLADITSVKEWPMKQMESAWGGNVVGTHPLFGPKTSPEEGLKVAVTPGKKADKKSVAEVKKFFEALDCQVFITDAKKHDQAVARIQNMNFITNLAYFAVLAENTDLLPFITPSFERRKKAAAKMLNEDAEMFAGLFEANNHSHEAVREFRKMLNIAASGDIEVLCKRAQWWWNESEEKRTPSD